MAISAPQSSIILVFYQKIGILVHMSSTPQSIVEKMMTALKLREIGVKLENDLHVFDTSFSKPFITISREPGSGGKVIGQLIAKKLHYAFYDHELIDEIAHSTKLRKSILDQVDEKGRSGLQDLIQELINPDYVSDITYFTHLCRVILTLAYKGNVVILGRGANFITPQARGLHVRCTAPQAVLVQRAVDFEGHTPLIAKEIVAKYSKDRRDFVKQYFDKDIRKPEHYDLVLNTTFYSPEESSELIIQAMKHKLNL